MQANEERKDLKTVSAFSPEFTHSIFGEEESIFGYKGLTIKLRFAAHDLRPNVHISYDERFEAVEDTKPLDLNETLREWLSPGMGFNVVSGFLLNWNCIANPTRIVQHTRGIYKGRPQ